MSGLYNLRLLLLVATEREMPFWKALLREGAVKGTQFFVNSAEQVPEGILAHKPDLFLLDAGSGQWNSRQISNLLELVNQTPVLLVVDSANEVMGEQAVRQGAADYLVKGSFDNRQLARAVQYALNMHQAQARITEYAARLSHTEQRLTETQRMMSSGDWQMDIVTNAMTWSDEVFRIFGLLPHSFNPTLTEYLNYVHREEKDKVEDFFEQVAKDGRIHSVEHRITVDGTSVKHILLCGRVHFDEQQGHFVVSGAIQDISKIKTSSGGTADVVRTTLSLQPVETLMSEIRGLLDAFFVQLSQLESTLPGSRQTEYLNSMKASVADAFDKLSAFYGQMVLQTNGDKNHGGEVIRIKERFDSLQHLLYLKYPEAEVSLHTEQLPDKVFGPLALLDLLLYTIFSGILELHESKKVRLMAEVDVDTDDAQHPAMVINIRDRNRLLSFNDLRQVLSLVAGAEVPASERDQKQVPIRVAAQLLRLMKGSIAPAKSEGEKVQLIVRLPVRLLKNNNGPEAEVLERPLRILLAEDHFLHQMAIKKALLSWSDLIQLDLAKNGREAIEKQAANAYDLILMDTQMPQVSGMEAAQKIRQVSDIPIIGLATNPTKQESDRCLAAGMNGYLAKNAKTRELGLAILSALHKAGEKRHSSPANPL